MTFEEKAIDMMFKRGMSKVQAHEILKMVKEDSVNDPMKGRWHDNMEGYPDEFSFILWYTVKEHALEYIDEKIPQAWFRPMFEEK